MVQLFKRITSMVLIGIFFLSTVVTGTFSWQSINQTAKNEVYISSDMVVINGSKTWQHGNNPEENRPESIVVYLYADGQLAVQLQVTEKDNWNYSFEMPKYAEDGHQIVYTIDENDVDGYSKAIDGYNLINTYEEELGDQFRPLSSNSPDTDDRTNLITWFILVIASGTLLVIASIFHIKERKAKHCKRRF